MKRNNYSDHYNDIINLFEHEDRHFYQGNNSSKFLGKDLELDALEHQRSSPTFKNTTPNMQKEVDFRIKSLRGF